MCHAQPSQFVDSQESLSVCLVQLLPRTTPSVMDTKLLLFDHDDQRRFIASCDSHNELTTSSPILRNQTFSLQIAPLALSICDQFSSFHSSFPFLPILILFMTCAAERGRQLSHGLSSAMRTLVFCSTEIPEEFHIVVSLLSQPFPHDRWPCDQPSSGPCRNHTSAPTHARINASWSAFVLGSLSHFEMILAKTKIFDETNNKMKWSMLWDRFGSQHVTPD